MARLIACGIWAIFAASPVADDVPDRRALRGEILPLTEIVRKLGIAADPSPISNQVALRDESGSIVPLVLDDGSRALFQDARLQRRPVRLDVRRFPSLPYVQVLGFEVREGGRYRTPEYWCEVCSIRWKYDPGICPCCQGPMELRMNPEPESGR